MKKKQLTNAILLLLAFSLLAIYVYSKTESKRNGTQESVSQTETKITTLESQTPNTVPSSALESPKPKNSPNSLPGPTPNQ